MAATHKIAPTNPRLSSLLSDVARGNIKIPVFQREYVWSDEQIMSLLDSIYRGYPVGSLLLWSTKEKLNHERDVGGLNFDNTRRLSRQLCSRRTAAFNNSLRRVQL